MSLIACLVAPAPSEEELRAFVRKHKVAVETTPHIDLWDHRRVQTALDVSLFATRSPTCRGDAGCLDCLRLWEGLRDLALRAIPAGAHYAFDPFDVALHLRPETGWEPEVQLVVEIRPRDEGLGLELVDDVTRTTVAAVLDELERFGVARVTWRERARTDRAREPSAS